MVAVIYYIIISVLIIIGIVLNILGEIDHYKNCKILNNKYRPTFYGLSTIFYILVIILNIIKIVSLLKK